MLGDGLGIARFERSKLRPCRLVQLAARDVVVDLGCTVPVRRGVEPVVARSAEVVPTPPSVALAVTTRTTLLTRPVLTVTTTPVLTPVLTPVVTAGSTVLTAVTLSLLATGEGPTTLVTPPSVALAVTTRTTLLTRPVLTVTTTPVLTP
ncbi:hypothetical protein ACH9EU_11250, partial [Kocuria sp. M1R5S2]|uniref:hypothetical protein n=1 Tax=Kocuria rhizosphaerae TaxID=3376285 RepID=UPI0037AB5022